MGVSTRQFQRVIKTYRNNGAEALLNRNLGVKPHNAFSDELVDEIVHLYETVYFDIGPLQASEYLAERHGIKVSKEGLRKILISRGLWESKGSGIIHRRARDRRTCVGEMIQMDSSIHPWLGESAAPFWLIICVDDASSTLYGRFFDTDSTETNMTCLKGYFESYGLPLSLYTDRASHFTSNPSQGRKAADTAEGSETQSQRALRELGIEQILARSAPAKGRVERMFRTLQDRLVHALRVNDIQDKEQAAVYLRDTFLPRFNNRFAIAPKSQVNAHRPVQGHDLEAILSVQEKRVVRKDGTIQFNTKRYQLHLSPTDGNLQGKHVVVEQRLNGRMAIRHGKVYYKYHLVIE